jgi:glycerol-3-phosphate dehydrogenase (NAD(P)+)
MNVTVIGSGSWGTAFARLLHGNGHAVNVLTLTAEEAAELDARRVNEHFLPGVAIPHGITFTALETASLDGSELIVYAVPTQAVREVARWVADRRPPQSLQLSLARGIELHTLRRPTEIIFAETGATAAALSGPNHAEEVSRDMPSATVIAADDDALATTLQRVVMTDTFRVYRNSDTVGVEFCGAAKNPVAIAVGMSDGLGYGDNTRASLITRSLAEVARLGMRLGARFETFAGLAGIGDMIATCTSLHSRNRKAGELLAGGHSPGRLQELVGQVVEGIPTAYALHDLSDELGVEMPVCDNVYQALELDKDPHECVRALMSREPKMEGPLPPQPFGQGGVSGTTPS